MRGYSAKAVSGYLFLSFCKSTFLNIWQQKLQSPLTFQRFVNGWEDELKWLSKTCSALFLEMPFEMLRKPRLQSEVITCKDKAKIWVWVELGLLYIFNSQQRQARQKEVYCSLVHPPQMAVAVMVWPGHSQKPEGSSEFPTWANRGSSIWDFSADFSKAISRKLSWKWNTRNSRWYTYGMPTALPTMP